MKKSLLISALVTLPLFTPFAWAADAHQHGDDQKPSTNMTEKDKQMQMEKMQIKMQENMLRMHEQLHKIMEAKTPEDREMRMKEHAKLIQDNMHMMKGMMGGSGKMDGGKTAK